MERRGEAAGTDAGAGGVHPPVGGVRGRLLPADPDGRAMAWATLANTIGHGTFMVSVVLYFTRVEGYSATSVGLGLSVAGLFGLVAGVPLGHLSDRVGARELLIVLLLATGVLAGVLPFVGSWGGFVVVASAMTAVDRGSAAVRSALIATASAGPRRLRLRSYLRAVNHVGIGIGASIGGVALLVDTRTSYVTVLLLNALSCWVTAVILLRHSHVLPVPRADALPMTGVFRDRPYVVVTLLLAVTGVQYSVLDVAMPLWIERYTSAPTAMVAVLFVVNTVAIVLLQVSVGRRVESVRAASRAMTLVGISVLAACAVFSATEDRPVGATVALLVVAALLHVVAEMAQTAAQFCLGQDLAPDHAQGQYQGMATSGFSLAAMLGPAAMTLLPVALGPPGWWILGAVVLGVAMLVRPAVVRAEATRAEFGVVA